MCGRSHGLPGAWQTGLGSGELPRAACQDSRHPFLNLFRAMNLRPSTALGPSARPPLCQHKLRPSQIPLLQEDFQECPFLVSVGRTRKGLLSAPSRETGREDGLDRRPSSQEARDLAIPRLSLGPACWMSLGSQGAWSIGEHWGTAGSLGGQGWSSVVSGGFHRRAMGLWCLWAWSYDLCVQSFQKSQAEDSAPRPAAPQGAGFGPPHPGNRD